MSQPNTDFDLSSTNKPSCNQNWAHYDDTNIDPNNKNIKKRSFDSYDNDNSDEYPEYDTYTVPIKKQKTSHPTDNENTWQCQLCTLKNRMSDERCSICSSPKPTDNASSNNDNNDIKEASNNKEAASNNNISTLINGLKNFRLNQSNNNDDDDNSALHSMDGIIDKLQGLQFDPNANSAINDNPKMNDIMNKLSNLDVSNSNTNDINSMVHDINTEINKFIIELQQSIYWRFKIKNEENKFKKIRHKESINRIVNMLTFYGDHHNEEFKLFEYVNDTDSDYKYLKIDYKNIINDNILSNNNIITMKKEFALCRDYISQNLPICDIKTCLIFKRYHDEKDEDEDMMDDNIKYLQKTMDILHSYLFHSDHCGIIISSNNGNNNINQYKHLKFGGDWYWFYDDTDIKWIPYKKEDQIKLNEGWRNMKNEVIVGINKYKVKFKRDSNNNYPSGQQYDYHRSQSWRRAVIYGIPDNDGLLNGIQCEKKQNVYHGH